MKNQKRQKNNTSLKLRPVKKARFHKPRKLAKTVMIVNKLPNNIKGSTPLLKQKQFKKLLKANIEKQINTGNFKKAKSLIPVYRKLLKGKITPLIQKRLEAKGIVGTYTVEPGDKRGYTISKVYNKFKLQHIMPNDSLTPQMYKLLKNEFGYSTRTLKTLKARQFIAETTPLETPKDIEKAERQFKYNGLSWSGSPDFDTVIQYMGGLVIAISKYQKEVEIAANRYGVNLEKIKKDYLPNFRD